MMVCQTLGRLKLVGKALTLALASCLVLACSTYQAYQGPELPDADVGTINCYTRFYFIMAESCHVSMVDGRGSRDLSTIGSNTTKLTPGRHWLNIEIYSNLGGAGGSLTCGFELDVQAGHVYQIKAHSMKPDGGLFGMKFSPGFFFPASIELDLASLAGERETRRIPATCHANLGSVCRQTSDCLPNSDMECIHPNGDSFGHCGFKSR